MNRTTMMVTLAAGVLVVTAFGRSLLSHGAEPIALFGVFFGTLAIGMSLGHWQALKALRETNSGSTAT